MPGLPSRLSPLPRLGYFALNSHNRDGDLEESMRLRTSLLAICLTMPGMGGIAEAGAVFRTTVENYAAEFTRPAYGDPNRIQSLVWQGRRGARA